VSDRKGWGSKLDAYSRLQLEEGLPESGFDVTVRLADRTAPIQPLESAGLKNHVRIGDIIVGRVSSETDLKRIAELDFVREVQLARPLYEDQSDSSDRE
jgi:hypothetical protein